MKSDVSDTSGRTARTRRILSLYSRMVWPRFIIASTRSEPDCTGRCTWLTSFGSVAYASMRLLENSTGCDVV